MAAVSSSLVAVVTTSRLAAAMNFSFTRTMVVSRLILMPLALVMVEK